MSTDLAAKRGLFTYRFEELPISFHPPRVSDSHNFRDTNLKATFLVSALIVFGMLLDAVGVGGLFAVGGAAGGAAASVLAGAVPEHEAEVASRA